MITDFHAKYYAHEVSRVGGEGIDRLGRALFDACVDMNPHQIEAALFALRSPLSKGVVLADEVGLGKTIEAGLVICQYWAERRRRILIITPASLRKQWAIELSDKFNLPCFVLDAKTLKETQKQGIADIYGSQNIIICSMNYAAANAERIKTVPWDIVVIDEAHKLRNAYRQSNQIGQQIRWATDNRKKLLLTATPLQNSLAELYGLSTLIDENLFGDISSFRNQYINSGGDLTGLRDRLASFCYRTLRRQVVEFVRYTERKLITRPFKPTEQEQNLYNAVSDYLKRDATYALPSGQKHLLILLVRKVLASSPHAVAGTLEIMRNRLLKIREEVKKNASITDLIIAGDEIDEDLLDEILEDEEDELIDRANVQETENESSEEKKEETDDKKEKTDKIDLKKLDAEIQELTDYINMARSIGTDTKTKVLLKALEIGFEKMQQMGAAPKVVIFTESRRTQAWLKEFLEGNGYKDQVLVFNGTNTDAFSGQIYQEWLQANKNTGIPSGSKSVDIRTAIIDRFKNQASILIATEAGAEGLNLQFCSAIINFDLPWNPQRIEQRIGRCHRYGQKYDVVVINFLNERNEADRRVYELLEQKFNLFTGVFGASDDVLGAIDAGIDFERRILEIYQQCRTAAEIKAAFKKLQAQLDEKIQNKMRDTRKILMEHFDEDVHERLKVNMAGTRDKLDRIGRLFWAVTKHALIHNADFDDKALAFDLNKPPISEIPAGRYHLISKKQENIPGTYLYRLSHPLGEHVLTESKKLSCPTSKVVFDISGHGTRIALVEKIKKRSGWLKLQHLKIDSFDTEEYLLFSAVDDKGNSIDQETCQKLFNCEGTVDAQIPALNDKEKQRLEEDCSRHTEATIATNLENNNKHYQEACIQLDKWAEDMEMAAAKEMDNTKREIASMRRQVRMATNMQQQAELQNQLQKLEKTRRQQQQKIFDIEDEIATKRDSLIEQLTKRMKQRTTVTPLFTIKWQVI